MSDEQVPKQKKKAPAKKKESNLKYWFIAGFFVVLIKSFNSSKDNQPQTTVEVEPEIQREIASEPTPPKIEVKPVAVPVSTMPEDQNIFIKIVLEARTNAKEAQNEMQKGGIKAEREKSICELTKDGFFIQNWEGKVSKLDSTSEGAGILAIEIASGIVVQTAEIELGFEMEGGDPSSIDFSKNNVKNEKSTLLDPSSELFKKVSQLKEGQKVKFSGEFSKGEDGDCLEELSLTLDGKLSEPQFIMRFSSVEPI